MKSYEGTGDQSSIAWFKLAELVARGERERAFSIHRLLTHAWNNEAYAAHIKGDLWCAFREYDKARESYLLAMSWYDSMNKPCQAAFIGECLIPLDDSLSLRVDVITRFAELGYSAHVVRHLQDLYTIARKQGNLEECAELIKSVSCSPHAYALIQNYTPQHCKNQTKKIACSAI